MRNPWRSQTTGSSLEYNNRQGFYFDFKDVTAFVRALPPTKCSVLRVSTKVLIP